MKNDTLYEITIPSFELINFICSKTLHVHSEYKGIVCPFLLIFFDIKKICYGLSPSFIY
jgi:hypothetical protein